MIFTKSNLKMLATLKRMSINAIFFEFRSPYLSPDTRLPPVVYDPDPSKRTMLDKRGGPKSHFVVGRLWWMTFRISFTNI